MFMLIVYNIMTMPCGHSRMKIWKHYQFNVFNASRPRKSIDSYTHMNILITTYICVCVCSCIVFRIQCLAINSAPFSDAVILTNYYFSHRQLKYKHCNIGLHYPWISYLYLEFQLHVQNYGQWICVMYTLITPAVVLSWCLWLPSILWENVNAIHCTKIWSS